MSFPRYPKYKDSGVERLGEVPGHWEVKRLRFAAELNPSKSEVAHLGREIMVSFLPMEAIGDDGALSLDKEKTIGELESGYTYFRDGDVTVAKITPCYENGKGAVMRGLTGGIGFGTTELIVARPKSEQVSAAFLHYLFISPEFRRTGESHMYGAGGQKRVPDAYVRNFAAAFPPLAEQTAIAEFLDRETAKIDDLVAEQRRLMELLKEKRQTIISHAVTRGLNPGAPLMPSGIDWFGEVPQHWSLGFKLKTLAINRPAAFTNGPFGSDLLTSELQEEGVPVIYIRDLKVGGYCRTSSSNVTAEKAKELDKFRVDSGDILIAKVGDPPGFCCTYPAEEPSGIICQDVIRMKPNTELIDSDYICFLLNSRPGMESIDSVCIQLTRKRFSLEDLHSLRLPIPPKREQTQIAAFLREHAAKFDALTAEAQRAIVLLQERRTALISAAVTGQIDVRQIANSTLACPPPPA